MSPGVQITLSGLLTFGVPLMLAAHELIVLRRRGGGGSWPRRAPAPPPRPLSWQPSLPPLRPGPSVLEPDWTKDGADRQPERV